MGSAAGVAAQRRFQEPGKVYIESSGPGSESQLCGVLSKVMAGVDLVMVNYRGIPLALPDVMSGKRKSNRSRTALVHQPMSHMGQNAKNSM